MGKSLSLAHLLYKNSISTTVKKINNILSAADVIGDNDNTENLITLGNG
jgi:hypothetical protein